MGDRALVVFEVNDSVSPVVYLHWSGSRVPELIEELKELMQGREGDLSYTVARFIGICHSHIGGNLSLGVWNLPVDLLIAVQTRRASSAAEREMEEYSHGDAGLVIVNATDFTWQAYGGYLVTKQTVASSVAA